VRANGRTDQQRLNSLKKGVTVEGVRYGAVEATLDSEKGANQWLTVGIREGKNREVRKVLEHIGLKVNRLIRISFGPFELGSLKEGAVEEIPTRVLRDQIGGELEKASQSDFDAPLREIPKPVRPKPVQEFREKSVPRDREKPRKFDRNRGNASKGEEQREKFGKPKSEPNGGRNKSPVRRGGKRTPFRAPKGKR
jgi:23S rRNA pseudouridine2605 synthase